MIRLDSPGQAVPLARALLEGGIPVAEVTFRTGAAAGGIRAIRRELPGMLVGAGTVISTDIARQAVEAGAQFVVAPGFNPEVVDYVLSRKIPMVPGVATPSEVEQALLKGLDVLKFFPAEVMGGVRMLDALSGPFPDVLFVPTGGISAQNLADYLGRKNVLAVGGSWMIKQDLGLVTRLCREALGEQRAPHR